jgi:hypothetical protein
MAVNPYVQPRRLKRCHRCGRRARTFAAMAGWNAVVENVVVEFGYTTGLHVGYITGLLCPSCQTPEEHAEAVINEATLDFAIINGQLIASPKGSADGRTHGSSTYDV